MLSRKTSFVFLALCFVVLAASAAAADLATFYPEPSFAGKSVALPEGDYTAAQLAEKGIADKSIASLKVAPGAQVIVYKADKFQGDSMVFSAGVNGDAKDLNDPEVEHDLTRAVVSLRVHPVTLPDVKQLDQQYEQEALSGWWTASQKNKDERIQWWRQARFGCFMHWGVYAVLAGQWNGKSTGTYSEHIMRQAKIPLEQYKKVAVEKFNPTEFSADEWIKMLRDAGMGYLVITAKHHDGFAMFRSDAYYYDLDLTPFKRDPMLELREACTKYGLKFGFYYSQAFDWEHPDGAGNDWDYRNPGGDLQLWGGTGWYNQFPGLVPRTLNYYTDQKAIPELVELVKKYHPDILWGDTDGKLPLFEKLKMLKAVREADPNIVVNGRFCRGGQTRNFGDYTNTSDRPAELRANEGDWEAIPTTNESYGYKVDDKSHKPVGYFVQLLAKGAARGGNILLNVGPRADGKIDDPDAAILKGIGEWMKVNGESIHGSQKTPLDVQSWGESSRKGNTLYLHVFTWPTDGKLVVGGLKSDVTKACLLADADKKALKTSRLNENDLLIEVPAEAPDKANSVVKLELAGEPSVKPGRLLSAQLPNVLRVFDAKVSGVSFGDGKTGNDCTNGWSKPSQTITWNVRVNEAGAYNVALRYASPRGGGKYEIKIGTAKIDGTVAPAAGKTGQISKPDKVNLTPGDYGITIAPVSSSGELMKLYDLRLTAAK